MLDLYLNIKKYRLENGWSQDELAKKVGYTDRSSIAKIESGKFDLPQSKILLFAEVFGIHPGILMGTDGVSAPSLRQDETDLLQKYNQLNDTGQTEAHSHMDYLMSQERYTKDIGSLLA